MGLNIKKSIGVLEEFDRKKLKRSLLEPGASPAVADAIIDYIERHHDKFQTTDDIYRYALNQLLEKEPHVAIRYNLKKALLEFGPTGFPFEKYVVEVFKSLGYQTQLDQIIGGWCVDHEVDIILRKDNKLTLVECKFHNVQYYMTKVQVAMYTDARFYDIKKTWHPSNSGEELTPSWVVTNTKFTFEAIKYANCKHMQLLSWDYPQNNSLVDIIDSNGLYPITALFFLTQEQKQLLLNNGIVLCRDIEKQQQKLHELGFSTKDIDKIIERCCGACKKFK